MNKERNLYGSSPLTRGTHLTGGVYRLFFSVHPRLRGELIAQTIPTCGTTGSSPLTRGTLENSGIKTIQTAVHPRLRGELRITAPQVPPTTGSSPLTRGTLRKLTLIVAINRFIPAYAGNSDADGYISNPMTVHPRLRGELFVIRIDAFRIVRFIPAYAGNSLPRFG